MDTLHPVEPVPKSGRKRATTLRGGSIHASFLKRRSIDIPVHVPAPHPDETSPLLIKPAQNQKGASRDPLSPKSGTGPGSYYSQFVSLLLCNYLNVLLVALPFSFISNFLDWPPIATFFFSFFTLLPLAAMLGTFTEDLALRSNESLAALLNATFGNATELIISIFALKAEMYVIIKNSLIGSVLGNMLLVLGCACVAGGMVQKIVTFNANAVTIYCSLLLLACFGLIIPTAFKNVIPTQGNAELLAMSREISILMVLCYIGFLWFQLRTHKYLFDERSGDDKKERNAQPDLENGGADSGTCDEGPEEPRFSGIVALLGLGIVTILIAFESEFLVGAIQPTSESLGLSSGFISVILVPIVGNAAEHATAIVMAYEGKMDIALGVAVGSSIQIALFVVPLLVLISWVFGLALDLDFHPFAAIVLIVSVVITNTIVSDGHTHWLEGMLLLSVYCMLAISFIYITEY